MPLMHAAEIAVFTIAEFAALAKVHRATVYRWIAKGDLKVVHLGPGSPRITAAEAERFLGVSDER